MVEVGVTAWRWSDSMERGRAPLACEGCMGRRHAAGSAVSVACPRRAHVLLSDKGYGWLVSLVFLWQRSRLARRPGVGMIGEPCLHVSGLSRVARCRDRLPRRIREESGLCNMGCRLEHGHAEVRLACKEKRSCRGVGPCGSFRRVSHWASREL